MLTGQDIGFLDSLKISGTGMLVVMLELALLAVLVFLLSMGIRSIIKRKENIKAVKTAAPAASIPEPLATVTATKADSKVGGISAVSTANPQAPLKPVPNGQIELVRTDESTAAVIMAIVSNTCKIPLNRLRFIRIEKLDDKV